MVKKISSSSLEELEAWAKESRLAIFKFKTKSGVGHLASTLSCVDIVTSLLLDSETYFDPEHDRIIWGKGHGSPAVYPILQRLGFINQADLDNYGSKGGILKMHSDFNIPGCFYIGGSLGNGIGFAAGLAIARPWQKFVVILGDAELYEGSVWESLIFISHHNLSNLICVVDRNGLGILGETEKSLRLDPLKEKFEAFGMETHLVNGHSLSELRKVFRAIPIKPQVIIAETVKGKGVSYMEGKVEYHTIIPKDESLISIGLEELS